MRPTGKHCIQIDFSSEWKMKLPYTSEWGQTRGDVAMPMQRALAKQHKVDTSKSPTWLGFLLRQNALLPNTFAHSRGSVLVGTACDSSAASLSPLFPDSINNKIVVLLLCSVFCCVLASDKPCCALICSSSWPFWMKYDFSICPKQQ